MSATQKRFFTDAAREGARRARLERGATAVDPRTPKAFVVRLPWPSNRFAWEIRRYGMILLSKSDGDFASALEARAAGVAALLEHLP